MLICPQCQSENSDKNYFCAVCQAALSERISPCCSSSIPRQQEYCPSCGASSAFELRYALVAVQDNNWQFWQQQKYLDRQSRYLINSFESATSERDSSQYLEILVTDTQPAAKSSLAELFDRQGGATVAKLVPEIALPYLELDRFEPNTDPIYAAAIPRIYDAWYCDRAAIIILEARSAWQILPQLCLDEDLSYFQILYWFDEMAQLWEALKEVGCARSLLVDKNLRLDEDRNFCLQRLYYDSPNFSPNLAALGRVWQSLLNNFNLVFPRSLSLLLERSIAGEIATIPVLRSHLQQIVANETENLKNFSTVARNSFTSLSDSPTTILPLELYSLVDAGATNIGLQRKRNEDFFAIRSQTSKQIDSRQEKIRAKGLYLVCDGIGGHRSGDVASAMAVNILQDYFDRHWLDELPDRETIRQAIHLANEQIYRENINNSAPENQRMGTTLVMVLLQDTKVAIASVGDSRIYSVAKKSGLKQLTIDHQVAQQEIRRGVEPKIAYALPNARHLTQALGPRDNNFVEPYIEFLELKEDCLLLLCSDGFYDNGLVSDNWQSYLLPLLSSRANLTSGLNKLMDLAIKQNHHDNLTAIAIVLKLRPFIEPNLP